MLISLKRLQQIYEQYSFAYQINTNIYIHFFGIFLQNFPQLMDLDNSLTIKQSQDQKVNNFEFQY